MQSLPRPNSRFLFLACLLVSCALLSACRSAEPAKPAPIVCASDLDNAPFAYIDEAGMPAGRDVRMMKALADGCGRDLVWRRMPFDQLLDSVARNEVDVVCATLGWSLARSQRMAFSQPYFRTRLVVVCRQGAGEPQQLADLDGQLVAAAVGTTSELAVSMSLPAATLDPNPKGAATLDRLLSGEVQAAVMDEPAAQALVAGSGARLRILDEALAPELYSLAVAPERTQVLLELDRALAALREDGSLDALNQEYGLVER